MQDLSPRPGDLDPIETASVDELRALQLERLQWSVRHAYDNVAHYRASFDAAGVPGSTSFYAYTPNFGGGVFVAVAHS